MLHSGLCSGDNSLGSSLCCFSLCILSVILAPSMEEKATTGWRSTRHEKGLYQGWRKGQAAHLPTLGSREVQEEWEGKGETQEHLCDQPARCRSALKWVEFLAKSIRATGMAIRARKCHGLQALPVWDTRALWQFSGFLFSLFLLGCAILKCKRVQSEAALGVMEMGARTPTLSHSF